MAAPKLVSIVTGARVGICKSLTETLVNQGHTVIAVSRNISENDFSETLRSNIRTVKADMSKPEAALETIKGSLKEGEKIKYLVNGAAALEPVKPITEITPQDFTDALVLNVVSPAHLTTGLKEYYGEGARVLMIGSGMAWLSFPKFNTYATTKAALYRTTRGLNTELANVLVGWATPGCCWTEMYESFLLGSGMTKEGAAKVREEAFEPEGPAAFFAYVLSDKVSAEDFTTGDWDIYETSHREHWVTEGMKAPLAVPKF
mmetsp:Transcript_11032/g.12080  ORF Transcript_11032/g.12080 Transcript_11032/m.12080 type:complete len:260 (+) Transcript_11032:69-848(+)